MMATMCTAVDAMAAVSVSSSIESRIGGCGGYLYDLLQLFARMKLLYI